MVVAATMAYEALVSLLRVGTGVGHVPFSGAVGVVVGTLKSSCVSVILHITPPACLISN